MKNITYSVDTSIFDIVPTYQRLIIVIPKFVNHPTSIEIQEQLKEVEKKVHGQLHPSFEKWRQSYLLFGMNPKEFRPAHDALTRRIISGKSLPSINMAVDIGNIFSISHNMPIGVHPLDNISSHISLRRAVGNEVFVPFGDGEIEHPKTGEIILTEQDQVLTRAWVWRQSGNSLTHLDSKSLVINIDGFSDIEGQDLESLRSIAKDIQDVLARFNMGQGTMYELNKENPSVEFQV